MIANENNWSLQETTPRGRNIPQIGLKKRLFKEACQHDDETSARLE
jgi:hypothetical protein